MSRFQKTAVVLLALVALPVLADGSRVALGFGLPGAVQAATKVDIVAYLLKGNKMPAGSTELPKEVDGLKQIKYLANKH